MKRIFILFTIIQISRLIYADTDFGGSAEISALGLIPQNEYSSPTNPDNQIMQLGDVNINSSMLFRLDAWDDLTNFESMFKISYYPIGSLLYNPPAPGAELVKEMIDKVGENIISLDIYRLFIDFSLFENLTVSIGRKPYFIGYGYGWNPSDNLNPLKDPANPDAELKGLDSLSLLWSYENLLNLEVITALNKEIFKMGVNYSDLAFAANLSVILDGIELVTTSYLNLNDERSSKVNSLGFAFKKDLFGMGIYGELILLDGSRNQFILNSTPAYKEDLTTSFLVGAEYLFESDTNVVLEYYFNGEGYSRDERSSYEEFLELTYQTYGYPSVLHRDSNYTKQYLLLNINQSLYDYNTTLGLAAIYSIDSTNLMLAPTIELEISENMNIVITYSGQLDFVEDDLTEFELSPMKQMYNLSFKYSF